MEEFTAFALFMLKPATAGVIGLLVGCWMQYQVDKFAVQWARKIIRDRPREK